MSYSDLPEWERQARAAYAANIESSRHPCGHDYGDIPHRRGEERAFQVPMSESERLRLWLQEAHWRAVRSNESKALNPHP